MKVRTSFLTRCVAMVLALLMAVSGVNLGAVLQVYAAENSITVGELMAKNYDLSDAEKALLSSGYLAGSEVQVEYDNLPDGLVNVDKDTTTITAASKDGWVPTTGTITYGTNTKVIDLSSGSYNYGADDLGNAFTVKVDYVYDTTEVSVDTQSAILAIIPALKQGVANTDAVAAQGGNLYILEQAMPELVNLANDGFDTGNQYLGKVSLSDAGKAGIAAMNSQMTANGGKLNLSVMVEEYEVGAKTAYLKSSGKAMLDEVNALIGNLEDVSTALTTMSNNVSSLVDMGFVDATKASQIKTLANSTANLLVGLKAVVVDPWTVANDPALLNSGDAALDALVAALGELRTIDPVASLRVADASQTFNMSMFDVSVNVFLNTTQENVVQEYGVKKATVTLTKGTAKADILAAIAENGVETNALADWTAAGVYVDGKFDSRADELPETLTADITYTITYFPKNYTVTIADEEPAEYPYGYVLTLPENEDAEKAYDYKVNDVPHAQGDEVVVTEDLVITRTEGKSYTSGDLYTIVAGNFMEKDSKGYNILTSGALNDNEAVNVRYPDAADAESLLTLLDGTLEAKVYDASYNGLSWAPYTYGANGDENTFNGNSAAWSANEAKVIYRLDLTNYTVEQVATILNNAATLAEEADAQVATLNTLASYHDTMGQLDKTKLGALNGVIDVTDFTPDDGIDTDAKNLELRAYFKEVVSAIITNNLDGNDLKIYKMLSGYLDENTGGLDYYYKNSAALISEINMLSEYLGKMTAEEEALRIMVTAAGYPEYADKITDLETSITNVKTTLTHPNALIDLGSANLGKLITALETTGEVSSKAASNPWLTSVALSALDQSQRNIQIVVSVPTQNINFAKTTSAMDRGTVITAEVVNGLKAAVEADLTIDTSLYNLAITADAEGKTPADDVTALVGAALDENVIIYYTYTAKQFSIALPDGSTATVSVEDKGITLPTSGSAAVEFTYTLKDGEGNVLREIPSGGTITLSDNEFALAMAGNLVIEKKEKDLAVDALEQLVAALNNAAGANVASLEQDANGTYTGITVDADMSQAMKVIMALAENGQYTYVGLNEEGFKYFNNEGSLEICMQTLINAILKDEDFSNQAVIDLCENDGGKLFKSSLQLGQAADQLVYEDMDFVMNISGVPEQVSSKVDLIKTVSNYIQFSSDANGTVIVEVTLPDQVYGAYAAALIATGTVDKSDVNGLNQKVALQFLYDYLTAITGSEMDMQTYTNTLKKLGIDKDLTGYNNYYTKGVNAYNDYVTVTIGEDEASIDVSADGATVIDALIKFAGIEVENTILGMIKEYKAGGTIEAAATATLTNVDKTYYALIADVNAEGVTNKFEAPSSYDVLAAETETLTDVSAIILLEDVPGGLTISGRTVLDLNGHDVRGTIHSTGTLYIIDSSMDTYNAGFVEGSVSGNVTILGGNYTTSVDAFLMDGYYKDGTTVRNALYYIADENGTVTFNINGDVYEDENVEGIIPDYKALAIDIAADLLLNYAMSGKLTVAGNELVAVNIEDLVGLYDSTNRVETLANQLLDCVTIGEAGYENNVGFEAVVNMILEDLLDFAAISNALANDTALATYELTTEPWNIEIDHADDDYATVNVSTNADKAKTFNVALVLESQYNDELSALAGELANIVVADETFAEVDIPKPTYADKTLTVVGNGQANAVVDMSDNEAYPVMIAVILANGNTAKRAAVAEAINGGVDMDALKAVIDNTTVAEIFTALKVMSRTEDFAAMAAKVGITADVTAAGELEAIYHTVLCGVGKALEKLEITGMDSKLGNLYNAETGYYELLKEDIFRDKEITKRGYTALVELTADELLLKVKLFGEEEPELDCLWGDADHDNDVDNHDASLVFEYFMNEGNIDQEFCLIRTDVDQDGDIDNHDASIIFEYFMAEKTDELPEEPAN